MKNELILLSGANIPFIEGTVTIHQPTIYEISLIGEEAFFSGCELLRFSKDILNNEDKIKLKDYTDFDIVMSIINDDSASMINNVSNAKLVLELLFQDYNVHYTKTAIECWENTGFKKYGEINAINFLNFKEILTQMFCLKENSSAHSEYNAAGELAQKIAAKLQKRQQQLAAVSKPNSERVAIFSKYISILAVGQCKDINSLMQYTVYQLFDEFQRFSLKQGYDMYIKAKLAGAQDIDEPEDWMKDLHSD